MSKLQSVRPSLAVASFGGPTAGVDAASLVQGAASGKVIEKQGKKVLQPAAQACYERVGVRFKSY